MLEKNSPGFCVLPFYGISLPDNSPCCLLKTGFNIDDIRSTMLAGGRPDACSKCWAQEDNGLTSDRQSKNALLDFYWDRDLRFIEEDCRNNKYHTNYYHIKTDNICNAACTTCGSFSSTHWGKLENNVRLNRMSRKEIDSSIDYRTAVSINFVGGEPFLSKLNFYILEKLLDANNTDCFLQFTTNGSITPTSEQMKLLKSFKNVNFGVSIDGIGSVFEYLRYPLKWENVLDNLKLFQQVTNNVCATNTISNLNLIYYPSLVKWFESMNYTHTYNKVYDPEYFRPESLPARIKKSLIGDIDTLSSMPFFIGSPHTAEDDRNFELMKSEIARQDALKKIDIRNYMPEFCSLIGI